MPAPKTQAKPPGLNWTSPVRFLKGVGPEKQRLLARLELEILGDLFYCFPRRYERRFPVKRLSELAFADKECVSGEIARRSFMRFRGGRGVFRAVIKEGGCALEAVYYNQPFLNEVFEPRKRVLFYGKAEKEGSRIRMIHPEYEILKDDAAPVHMARWTPVYPLTEDLSQKSLRQMIHRAVTEHSDLVEDRLREDIRRGHRLAGLAEAFRGIHFPGDVEELKRAYRRLVFDEFFVMQLAVELRRAELRKESRFVPEAGAEEALRAWIGSLEFALTGAQIAAVGQILDDMKSGHAMHRLIQGDVGSGKTVVAAAAAFFAARSGWQAAVMAPTEVLAQQLFFQMRRFLEPSGIRCVYLAQGAAAADKEEALKAIASGEAAVAVGTHALVAKDVRFCHLGLAVVDEQHKFGVWQRSALKEKGFSPHFLLMTATPIPRTLSMTLYGDMDVSIIAEKPKGRLPVRTLWVDEARREGVYRWLDTLMAEGAQAYVICPAVEEARGLVPARTASAMQEFQRLSKIFPGRRLGLLHGRMKADEKSKVMQSFKAGKIDLLVSTVVVEVGVDVPNARCLVIENAERFGLAQLHQLRGRVGRGEAESYCLLFSQAVDEATAERLSAFETLSSGFDIAQKDLEQRGAGDRLGRDQHGLANFRIGNLEKDMALFHETRKAAEDVIAADPRLSRTENKGLLRMLRERFGSLQRLKKAASA